MAKKKGRRLSMRKIREIFRLSMVMGMKNRKIARICSISHTVVNDYINKAKEKGLEWNQIDGIDDEKLNLLLKDEANNEISPSRNLPNWEEVHNELKKKGVTLQLLWEEYLESDPDGYGRSEFYRKYEVWKKKLKVTLRQSYKAGEKMFVDYAGQRVPIIDSATGEIKDAQIYIAVLGASNYTYAEATLSQGIHDWIGSHVRTFEYLGGVPEIIVPDNLKS